jgi:hypothetical protein
MRQLILLLMITAVCLGCDPLANPVSGPVDFSSDTVFFDTVFTTVGSVTREFRAINRNSDPLLIDRIYLGGGTESPFRLNINGTPAASSEEITLAKGDSLFVFIDVTIDPVNKDNPVAMLDSVIFESGSYTGRVILEAWGQDIWLIEDHETGNAVWTEGKPYVITGSFLVDTTATLTLGAGTRVYFHHDAGMTVAGRLVSDGTAEKPVLFATDRLEPAYNDVPSRWKGISFLDCSTNNILNHTEVRNAVIAVSLEGNPSVAPDLTLNGAMLMHNSVASLVASNAEVLAVNTVFAHSGFSTVSLTEGGTYDFIHCTMDNWWEYSFRSEPVMFIGKSGGVLPEVTVLNTVISGSLDDELTIDAPSSETAGVFYADSSLIKVDTTGSEWYVSTLFENVQTSFLPRFIDESTYDYRPDTLSPLIDHAGKMESLLYPYDIRNKPRPTGSGSDIGAYERQPGEKKEAIGSRSRSAIGGSRILVPLGGTGQ